MTQFLLVYLGGQHSASSEQSQRQMEKYQQWIASLGAAAISPANPLKQTATVHSDGQVTEGGTTTMSGYSIIAAQSMAAALVIAQACPFLDIGGALEVSELISMPG